MNEINVTQLLSELRTTATAAQGKDVTQATQGSGLDFSSTLKGAIDKVNETQHHAKELSQAFEVGKPGVDLPQVMIAKQKASVSFQAMVQVRNKLVSAYQDIMNMQV